MHYTFLVVFFTVCVFEASALYKCKGGANQCNVNSEKRGVIEFDSEEDLTTHSFYKNHFWVLDSSVPTSFLLHLSQFNETRGNMEINNGGISILMYYRRGGMWLWSPIEKLMKDTGVLYIKNVVKIWIFWSGRRDHDIKFQLNYHVGCGTAVGDNIQVEKTLGSEDQCWIVVPKSNDIERSAINTKRGISETVVRSVETEDSFGTLQNIHVVGDAKVTVTNLAQGNGQPVEVTELDYDGDQENIPVNFEKSTIAVNKAKVTAAVLVDLQCDNNAQDCYETTFKFSLRALSSADKVCIENEMKCRLNGTSADGCPEDITSSSAEEKEVISRRSYPLGSPASDGVTPIDKMTWSQCSSYADILSDLVTMGDDVPEDESKRFSRQILQQCHSGAQVFTYCTSSYRCNDMRLRSSRHYNPTCHGWCRFLKTFYCKHTNKYRLF